MQGKVKRYGVDNWSQLEKGLLLQQLDQCWKEHLLALDHLRQGINLRAFGQRDPLNEYKTEAFQMFSEMLDLIGERTVQILSVVELKFENGEADVSAFSEDDDDASSMQESRGDSNPFAENKNAGDDNNVTQIRTRQADGQIDPNDPSTWGRVSRNADCPCGSGKKFKHCHGKLA